MIKLTHMMVVLSFVGVTTCPALWAGDVAQENRGPVYSPVGKRDPFRPPASESGRDVTSVNPLEKHSVEKFQLKAILKGMGRPRAMFEDPDARSFILSEGDTLGRERGTISRILNTEVIITERTYNYLGSENLYERVLSLPPDDALNEVDGGVKGGSGSSAARSSSGSGSASSAPLASSARSAPAAAPRAAAPPAPPVSNSGNVTVQGGNVR